jgi:hypothetical protein
MATIYKYPVPVEDAPVIRMPRDARILTLQVQHGIPCLWALIPNLDAPTVERRFRLFGTGHEWRGDGSGLVYVGTYQMHGGALVFHLFEEAGT